MNLDQLRQLASILPVAISFLNVLVLGGLLWLSHRQLKLQTDMQFVATIRDEAFTFPEGCEETGLLVRHWILSRAERIQYEDFKKWPIAKQNRILEVLMALIESRIILALVCSRD